MIGSRWLDFIASKCSWINHSFKGIRKKHEKTTWWLTGKLLATTFFMSLLVPSCPSIEGLNHIYSNSPSHVHKINSRNRRTNSIRITLVQWPFQEPKLDVPILYKAYIRLNLGSPSIGLDVLGIEEFQPAFGLAWHRVTHDVVGLGWIILNHGFFGRPQKIWP